MSFVINSNDDKNRIIVENSFFINFLSYKINKTLNIKS